MSNKNNKEDNILDKVPPGEDQYMFGWSDAERLETTKVGLAVTFFESEVMTHTHGEYQKGFKDYIDRHIEKEVLNSFNLKANNKDNLSEEMDKLLLYEVLKPLLNNKIVKKGK